MLQQPILFINQSCTDTIVSDALQCYPQECCGFLVGFEENDTRTVTNIIRCKNTSSNPKNTFLISAADYVFAEMSAEKDNRILLGVYHSHPNCGASPSKTDTQVALPYFSYVIVSVLNAQINDIKSWRRSEEFAFTEEKISHQINTFSQNHIKNGNNHHSYTTP